MSDSSNNEQLQELFSTLSNIDPEKAAEALHEHAPDVYQAAYDAGHATATGKLRAKVQELEERLSMAKDQLGDAASVEEAIQRVKREAAEQVKRERLKTFRSQVIERMASHGSYPVDPDIARVLLQGVDLGDRVNFDADGNPVEVIGSDGTPLTIPKGKSAADAFADDFHRTVPDKFKQDLRPGSTGLGDVRGASSRWDASETEKRKELERYR